MFRESSPLNLTPLALARQNASKARVLSPLFILKPLILKYRNTVLTGLAAVLIAGGCTLAIGQVFRHLVDNGIEAANPDQLHKGLIILLGLVLVLSAASYIRLVLLTGIAEQIIADLRIVIFKHLLRLDVAWFEIHQTGDLLSRFTADMSLLQVLLGTSMPIALRNLLVVVGGIIMMGTTSWALSFMILCLIPVIVIILLALTPRVRKLGRDVQERTGLVSAQLSESLGAMREVQAFTREDFQDKRFTVLNAQTIATTWRYMKYRALLSSLIILTVFCSITAMLWLGGHQVIDGTLTAGDLSAFVFYALLVAGSVGSLSEIYSDLQRAAGALERVDDILKAQSGITVPAQPKALMQNAAGVIALEHVSFSYPTRPEIQSLDDVSLTLNAGQTVAIVGPSGAGKTTLFALLLRFYDPKSGTIRIDGTDIRELDPAQYRGLFGLVPQDPNLFSMSIFDNIAFGLISATDAQVIQAMKDAGAYDFIQKLPERKNTILGERGTRLSGGQAQRIALARALLRDPKILLLDEATAHLDSETESAIQHTLNTNRKNRTTLIIAHRLSTVQHADRILVLENGRLAADGTHQELLNTSSLYQRLATQQLQK